MTDQWPPRQKASRHGWPAGRSREGGKRPRNATFHRKYSKKWSLGLYPIPSYPILSLNFMGYDNTNVKNVIKRLDKKCPFWTTIKTVGWKIWSGLLWWIVSPLFAFISSFIQSSWPSTTKTTKPQKKSDSKEWSRKGLWWLSCYRLSFVNSASKFFIKV